MTPDPENPVGSFTLGFLTLPEALAQMPAAQFWAVLFFFTLFLLGMSSAFAMIDALITMICDSNFGREYARIAVSSTVILISFLISIIYCTEFGYGLVRLLADNPVLRNLTLLMSVSGAADHVLIFG